MLLVWVVVGVVDWCVCDVCVVFVCDDVIYDNVDVEYYVFESGYSG